MIRVAVDRIEGEWLILIPDEGSPFQVPVSLFPGLRESEVVYISISHDEQGERAVKGEIDEIRKGLNRVKL